MYYIQIAIKHSSAKRTHTPNKLFLSLSLSGGNATHVSVLKIVLLFGFHEALGEKILDLEEYLVEEIVLIIFGSRHRRRGVHIIAVDIIDHEAWTIDIVPTGAAGELVAAFAPVSGVAELLPCRLYRGQKYHQQAHALERWSHH